MVKDPTLSIYELLRDNWDSSNTSINYDPNVSTGWFDHEANSPQVTVSNLSEGPIFGDVAPFSGIQGDGSGPVQEFSGTVEVNCWSDREVESSVNPKSLVHDFFEEVRRIVNANLTDVTDLRYIGIGTRNFLVDTDAEPTTFRYSVRVEYLYRSAT